MRQYFSSFGEGCRRQGFTTVFWRRWNIRSSSAALTATRGNQIKAADLLGLNRNTLRKKSANSASPYTEAHAALDLRRSTVAFSPQCVA